jgi:hypothetical protein
MPQRRRLAAGLLPLLGAVALASFPASAAEPSARLLDEGPRAVSLAPAPAVAAAAPEGVSFGAHFGKTVGLGVFGATAGAVAGHLLGNLSNNLIGAALPGALCNLLIGPVLTALGALLVGNDGALTGSYGFWGPLGVALGINAVVYIATSFLLPVGWGNPVALLLYSLVDGLLMTGGAVGLMHLIDTAPRRTASIPSFTPGVSDTVVVTLSEVRL